MSLAALRATRVMDSDFQISSAVRQGGFTYFGVLFIVTLIGLALSGAAVVWEIAQRREREEQLLFVGRQYLKAIENYYREGSGGISTYPKSIDELLKDPRSPRLKRYLRQPWRDPMTNSQDWGLVTSKDGRIVGIYSLATGRPLKQANFGELEPLLAGKSSYQDWRFVFDPQGLIEIKR